MALPKNANEDEATVSPFSNIAGIIRRYQRDGNSSFRFVDI